MAFLARWSVVGLLLCVGLIIDSVLPGGPRAQVTVAVLTLVSGIPVFIAAAVVIAEGRRPGHSKFDETRDLLRRLSRGAQVGLVVTAVCVGVLFASSFRLDNKGTAVKTDTGYAIKKREGGRIPATKQEYLTDRGADARTFLAIAVWGYALSGAICRGARLRDDEEDRKSGQQ